MSTVPPSGTPGFWTFGRVAEALAALADVNLPNGGTSIRRVWTDTRTVSEGDLFVALAGERFDAHDFVRDAIGKGAVGVVVSRQPPPVGQLGVPVFQVRDTLRALGALGQYRRRAWGKPVIAVAGTSGKTSTKELIRAALGSTLEVHATTGNLNNLVGVPLTLLALPDDADIGVIEMGTNQPGEVPRLRELVAPDIAVVTAVGEEHLEGLGDLAGVMREELAACEGVGVAIVPASQPEVAVEARRRAKRTVTAGLDEGDYRASSFSVGADGVGSMVVEGVEVRLPLRGVHNLRNAMLALAVAREAGVSVEAAAAGIEAMPMPPMRSNVEHHGRVTLINDAYNANPGSTRAALELLVHAGAGRQRVAVLGSMLEMGGHSDRLHDEVARTALEMPIDVIAAVGEFAKAFGRCGAGDPRVVAVADPDAVWPALASRVAPDAAILLKGSRGVRLERLVPLIREWSGASS